jgi:PKD repeat protein
MLSKFIGVRSRAFVAALALIGAGVAPVLFATQAQADTSPDPASGLPATVSADPLPTVQINGVVWSQVTVGNTVYAAGQFTSARPAGAAAGTGEVVHNNLLSFDITTGVMSSWNASLNGAGRIITVSPDNSTLYVGGDFTTANGQPRAHIAAFDIASGALKANFAPSINNSVRALAVTTTTVYAGGSFTTVSGTAKSQIVSLDAGTGAVNTSFNATSDGNTVTAMTVSPDATTLIVAGRFAALDGSASKGVGGVDVTTGALTPWNPNWPILDHTVDSSLTALKTVGSHIYGSGYTTNFSGNFEGSFEIDKTGNFVWLNSCHGDTYDVAALNGVLYTASHAHDCSDIGAWEETTPRLWHRALASTADASPGCTTAHNNNPPYTDFAGYPCATLLDWDPDFAAGTFTGASQGPWSASGNSQYLSMGGEFPTVNGIAQNGLVRFAIPSIAPKNVAPIAAATLVPNVLTMSPGTARISWKTTWDRDNQNLTYRLYRGSSNANLIYTVTAASTFFNMPNLGFTDTGQSTTATIKYHLTVSDPDGNLINIGSTPGIVLNGANNSTNPYYQDVLADGANNYYRFDEATGTNAVNSASNNDAITAATVTRASAGALLNDSDTASTFDGTPTGFASSQTQTQAPNTFSTELWFKTTTTSGGELISYGSANTGTSAANYDRAVYLDNAGHLLFGVNTTGGTLKASPNNAATILSSATYNDGAWHQVVATMSSAGMVLYADGKIIGQNAAGTAGTSYVGYWRIGGDNLTFWKNEPTSDFFAGSIDEVATYPTALSLARVQQHFVDSGRTLPGNIAPTASYTSSISHLALSVNGSASSDADGTIISYSWDFGDGSTGTGVTATHTYAAAGSYPVTLTVGDDGGATGTSTTTVVATAIQPPTASFTSTVTGPSVAFDASGSFDPDGTITSYAWTFGDGTTGTGVNPTHVYATAGTYNVTLTVTDDDSATGTQTNPVTTTTNGISTLASDDFGRTVASGWGSADVGGVWTVSSGASFAVANGAGTLTLAAAGSSRNAYLNSVSSTTSDTTVSFSVDKIATGGGTYVTVAGRKVAGQGEYRAKVQLVAGGAVKIQLIKSNSAGTESIIGTTATVAGLNYTAGMVLQLRLQVSGVGTSTLNAKVWSGTEPAWQVSATDTTAGLQAAGAIGLIGYASGSTTNAPITMTFDALRVTTTV